VVIFLFFFVFFFQAEDGIRDGHVTGVQTCALPIFLLAGSSTFCPALVGAATACRVVGQLRDRVVGGRARGLLAALPMHVSSASRSEEHTSELQSRGHLVCRLLLEKKNTRTTGAVRS